MAFCPRCHKDMAQTATICPHCGYDFPTPSATNRERTGFAYSGIATLALIVGQLVAALGCLGSIIGCVVSLVQGDWLQAFVFGPILALLMLGILVVFARTLDVR
jgi:vacuolar-type H+-ATPase subunit I/STV1